MTPRELRRHLLGQDTAPVWGMVLGSGFDIWLENLTSVRKTAFCDVEGIAGATTLGHEGFFCGGFLDAVPLVVCSGRLHLYEGLDARQVTAPVGVLAAMGISSLLLTTAVGATGAGRLKEGDALAISDQINLTGADPHEGTGRFPDASRLYDPSYAAFLVRNGLASGVLAGVRGPSYESPAEVRALDRLGADAVCMSTVLETLKVAGSGIRCAGIAVVANMAGTGGISHERVVERVRRTAAVAWGPARKLILSSC